MKYYLISTILFSLVYAVCAGPMKISFLEPVKDCVKSGMMCDTCTSSAMCVKVGNAFKKVNRMNCPDGTTCLGGTCTKDVNPPCDFANLDFPCQYKGSYPHPGDWSKYIYCIPNSDETLTAFTIECEPGTGYNAATAYCSRNLTTISPNVFPIERCLEPSQNPLVHPDNPSIYYICSQMQGFDKLYPMQFTCPSGGAFKDGECIITLSDESNRK